jgi:hypothetical protein
MTQRGNIDFDQIRAAARHGEGEKFQMYAGGSVDAGKVPMFNISGSLIDSGKLASLIGGGSGGSAVDEPPETPDPMDDEFEGVSLDPKWSWVNQGGATAVVQNGQLELTAPANSGNQVRILVQTLPAGSWEFRAKMAVSGALANYRNNGLALRETSTGRIASIEFYYSGGNSFRLGRWTSLTSFQSAISTLAQSGVYMYVRMTRDGAGNLAGC